MNKKRPANKLDIKLMKLKKAVEKARELESYIYKNELGDYESDNGISVDSAIYYDVYLTLQKEYKRIYNKIESLQASNLTGLKSSQTI